MRTTLRACIGASVLVLAASGCEPTGSDRCDAAIEAVATADYYGYPIDCTPPFDAPGVIGWTDHSPPTVYVWASKISDDRVLTKVLYHEVGHVLVHEKWDWSGTQAAEERLADGFAFCAAPQTGISYLWKPTPAECNALTA